MSKRRQRANSSSEEDVLYSDFSDEEKRHKEMKSRYRSITKVNIPQEIQSKIGEANLAYLLNDFQNAESLCKEIIAKYPTFADPYNLLGQMFEEKNLTREAAGYFFLAAYTTRTDAKTWEKIAYLYKKENEYESAGYCFGRALKSDTFNQNLWKERGVCYEQTGELRKSIKCLERILKMDENNEEIVKQCAKLYWRNGNNQKSIQLLKDLLYRQEENNLDIVHMISEIYIRAEEWQEMHQFLDEIFDYSQQGVDSLEENLVCLPVVLLKVFIIVFFKLEKEELADMAMKVLLEKDESNIQEFDVQLVEDIGDNLKNMGYYEQAYQVYQKLIQLNLELVVKQDLLEKSGLLYSKMHDLEDENQVQVCIDQLNLILKQIPASEQIRMELSSLYQKKGQGYKALEILGDILSQQSEEEEEQEEESKNYRQYINNNSVKIEDIHSMNQNLNDHLYKEDQFNEDQENQIQNEDEDNNDDEYQLEFGEQLKMEDQYNNNFNQQNKRQYQNEDEEEYDDEQEEDEDEEDEEVFLSDDENKNNQNNLDMQKLSKQNKSIKKRINKQIQEQQKEKKKRKLKKSEDLDSDYDVMEDIKKKVKLENISKMQNNLLKTKEEKKEPNKQDQLFFNIKCNQKQEIMNKYSFKSILMNYQRGQILFKNPQFVNQKNLKSLYNSVKLSLKLEIDITSFTRSINNKFLLETQKRSFKTRIKALNTLQQFDKPQQSLMIRNKKHDQEQEILMKQKKIQAKKLTDRFLGEMKFLSKHIGPEEYLEYIIDLLKLMHSKNMNKKMLNICTLAVKLSFMKSKNYTSYKTAIYNFALACSIQLNQYEKAFLFLRNVISEKENSMYLTVIMNLIFNKINNGSNYRTFMNQLSKKTKKWDKFQQIISNNHMETANYEIAIKFFEPIYKQDSTNSLINLSMAVCYLQLVTTRVTQNKEELCRKAKLFMELYNQSRGEDMHLEKIYNMGRFYTHLKLNERAFHYYNQVMQVYFEKQYKGILVGKNDRIIFLKAVHNMVILHKRTGNLEIANDLLNQFFNFKEQNSTEEEKQQQQEQQQQ